MPPNTVAAYEAAPLDELLSILLRQFKRPLAAHGIALTDTEVEQIARAAATRTSLDDERIDRIRAALGELIAESETVLARMGLTFAQSLDTGMDQIAGWETTAEFLELANEKVNAELRISTGSALLVALGDLTYARALLFLVERAFGDAAHSLVQPDLDAVIARRVLCLVSGIDPASPDVITALQAWVGSLPRA